MKHVKTLTQCGYNQKLLRKLFASEFPRPKRRKKNIVTNIVTQPCNCDDRGVGNDFQYMSIALVNIRFLLDFAGFNVARAMLHFICQTKESIVRRPIWRQPEITSVTNLPEFPVAVGSPLILGEYPNVLGNAHIHNTGISQMINLYRGI